MSDAAALKMASINYAQGVAGLSKLHAGPGPATSASTVYGTGPDGSLPDILVTADNADAYVLLDAPANPSGITPLAFKVLILPDPVEEVTRGGIIRPTESVTKDEFATTKGRIIAVASAAFSHVTAEEWGSDKPTVGDHVVYTKYAGFRHKGKGADGKDVDYLIVKDEDIHAKLED